MIKIDSKDIRNNSKKGLTLIELLVVISLVGILGTVSIASFNKYSNQQAVSQAALSVKTMIEKAKNNAVSRVKPTDAQCSMSDKLERYEFDIQAQDIIKVNAICNGHRIEVASENLSGNITINKHPCKAHFYVYYGAVDWGTANGSTSTPIAGNPNNLNFGNNCRTNGTCVDGEFCILVQSNSVIKTILLDKGGNVSIQ